MIEPSLHWIPLFPFIGAALLFLFGRRWQRDTVHVVATGAIALACVQALLGFYKLWHAPGAEGGEGAEALVDHVWTWLASGDLKVSLTFRMDHLAAVMCFVITFIGTLIHVYSWGYMAHDDDYARFFAYLNLFCGSMLVLVLGDSLPVMFVGWEGVGLCSYLLIGFWYGKTANADAGKKAFITNRIGDLGFVIGMLLLFEHTGTMSFGGITEAATAGGPLTAPLWLGQSTAFWACVFLFIGACGKSAQLPLYVWLPDAMAGPTPVSALIHAATMVTAGVYMVARLHAVYVLAPAAMAIVAVVGALTAAFAAIIGFAQNDFKKVLAYSTVSQLGFMFVGVGTGNFSGGVFHLFTHAFFKAGLFLCAGSVMHAMSDSGDITQMGALRKKIPITHAVFFVCWLAICGIPPFSGFWSKDGIVAGAFATGAFAGFPWVGKAVGGLLLLAALGTAFYMSRLYFLVFSGEETRCDEHTKHHIHESPGEMTWPLRILAAGALLAGLVGTPIKNLFAHWLEPSVGAELEIAHSTEIVFSLISTAVAVIGIVWAAAYYRGGYKAPAHNFAAAYPGFTQLVRDKFRVDELYQASVIRWTVGLARGLYRFVDRILIDRVLVHGVAAVVDGCGRAVRMVQTGDGQRYLAVFSLGVAGLVWFSTRPGLPPALKIKGCRDTGTLFAPTCEIAGLNVDVDAGVDGSTRALTYEFDFDSDGVADHRGNSPKAHFAYEGAGLYTIKVTVSDPQWRRSRTLSRRVRVK